MFPNWFRNTYLPWHTHTHTHILYDSYGIQEFGGTLIKKIDGCYFNVMGFPMYSFCQEVYKWFKEWDFVDFENVE